ncbi:MAG TPA: hypothetical protein VF814_17735 [Casimicrobiaceae bacterium]
MTRRIATLLAAAVLAFGAAALATNASARESFAVSIGVPGVAFGYSNGYGYGYVAPAPSYYYYAPPAYYAPPVVGYYRPYYRPYHRHYRSYGGFYYHRHG